MIILGIDPGSKQSGYVFLGNGSSQPILEADVKDNNEVLNIIRTGNYDVLAIENIRGYGIVAGDDTFDTCTWIGRFDSEQKAMLIGRKDIKKHLCGNTTTNDKYVRQALIDRYGEQGTKRNKGPLFGIARHMWAALAVATTARDRVKECN